MLHDDTNLLKRIEQLEKALERATKCNGAARGSSSKKTGSKKGPVHAVHPVVVRRVLRTGLPLAVVRTRSMAQGLP